MSAGEAKGLLSEQSLEHEDEFLQPGDTDCGRVEADSGLVVFRPHPTRPDADLDPTVGEHIECGQLLGQHCGSVEVVSENGLCDPQCGGGVSHRLEGDQRGQRQAQMIRHRERGVADVLGAPRSGN